MTFVAGGVDIGGTFTDCVLFDADGRAHTGKASTTPGDLLLGFFDAIDAAARAAGRTGAEAVRELTHLAHGTTVATNIMVQGTGARVGLLTTRGHADAVVIQRSAGRVAGVPASRMIDLLAADKPDPLVARDCIAEIGERVDVDGAVVATLDRAEVGAAVDRLVERGVDALAIAYLWSFRNGAHEDETRAVIEQAHPGLFVSVSHDVAPSWGEYERAMTAIVNSYVGLETRQYVGRMDGALAARGFSGALSIMESTGGVADPASSADLPVRLIMSGPAGALVASAALAAELGVANAITSDMGGTSFDVGLIVDGEIVRTDHTAVDRYEVLVPSVDVRSIGSGGGSIAWVDEVSGGLRVGPHSAGALPGPAAYGRGGTAATVTDADLLLGYVSPDDFLGGRLVLDRGAAATAVGVIADRLGVPLIEAAAGIRDVVDAAMADAIRLITVAQGHDPREFTVLAFGGAGPLHAADYARELGIARVVVPRANVASAWSAYGVAAADAVVVEQHAEVIAEPIDMRRLERVAAELEARARDGLVRGGVAPADIAFRHTAKLKFRLQVHALEVALEPGMTADELVARFAAQYEERYGRGSAYRDAGVEVTGISCQASGRRAATPGRPAAASRSLAPPGERTAYWPRERRELPTLVFRGEHLGEGWAARGPAVVDLPHTTVLVPPDASAAADEDGNIVLELA